jgi:hypothetical protein
MNRLNKIITLILTLSFLLSGVAMATIEKDTTKKKTDNTNQNVTPGDSANNAGRTSDSGANSERPKGYDNFVDKNNNGIDDRAERKQDGRQKDSSQGNSDSNSLRPQNQNGETNRLQRSPDDSVVKLKTR